MAVKLSSELHLSQNESNKPERGLDVSLRTIFQPLSDSVIYSAIESIRAPQSREAIHRAAVFCIILARLKVSNSGNNFLISSRPKIVVVAEAFEIGRVPLALLLNKFHVESQSRSCPKLCEKNVEA